ncbi:organic solute transporter Ostalpha-domain-containing protein [Crucibulum laeve]|uniref:Organic solute transporter Ostalpha-domain-containing protein n=1 Tax=Crucibulum laeve TaxID=68775 RepID=A0A5C3LVS8_9AGAR|nr:organic solute transporter Ostalpha-domain-containing protein [Crucibulum laeve]
MASIYGEGAGSRLPTVVLVLAGVSTFVAVLVSGMSIHLQLKNYRKPVLQRMVIRIMLMVPIYGIASLISLFSVEAAFIIDAIRDIYEAFVIYCFFVLLLSYLGGERSLLILLHGRQPKEPVFPLNLFKREIDVSDPYTFLFLKRGILQYVQVKPILAAVTLILKACGKFNEGDFRANSGYLYVSIVYNTSICLSLYCLAMFWVCVNDDLKPFRPVPKFLCVKGILFFSFWQSVAISVLVAARVITKLGPYTDPENVSVGLNDTLICLEMPFFAIAHMYAFSYRDYIDPHHTFVARMPMYYAFRDAFGLLDVVEDSKATLRGEGMDYREFEPAEGFMHQGVGRERRIRAGLRYSKGGQRKYWLPKATADTQPPGRAERVMNRAITKIAGGDQGEQVHAPLLQYEAEDVVHLAPDMQSPTEEANVWGDAEIEDGYELPFGDLDDGDEELFEHSKKYLFGDYNYPCIDVSSESARTVMWDEEERVLRDERGAWFSPIRGAKGLATLQTRDRPAWQGYGAVGTTAPTNGKGRSRAIRDELDEGDGKVIDYEQDRVEGAEPKDVKLKWTKVRSQDSRSASHSQSPHLRNQAEASSMPSSSGSSSGNSATRIRSPPSMSRDISRATASPLPPDAVDLVVEDSDAAEEEQTRDRRKGEPSVRGSGLRKVYRRGFTVRTEDGEHAEGEVEIEEPGDDDRRRIETGEEILDAIGDESEEGQARSSESVDSTEWTREADGIVARAGTPPLHAQVKTHEHYHIPDDDNPWA